jgi:sirohydrochlorin ferrochelatase
MAVHVLREGVHAAVRRRRAALTGLGRHTQPAGAVRPVLLAVAHGSRDPSAGEHVGLLASKVQRLARDARVEVAFVQNAHPPLDAALAGATAEVGAGLVTIVPLLMSSGYHLSSDIAGAAQAAGVAVAGPLGPDLRLVPALAARLAEAGVPAGTPVVLAAAGSSDPRAAADARRQASLLGAHLGVPVVAAFGSAARPTVPEAVSALGRRTGRPVAVAAYLLAPGFFHGRLRRAGAAWVTAPLAGHGAVARLAVARFRAAAACPQAA